MKAAKKRHEIEKWELGNLSGSPRPHLREDGVATRCDQLLQTPIEKKIGKLISEVEEVGAHPFLTEVVVLLDKAKNKFADFVELPE